jgi:sulfite exporter TauE/SafE
MPTPMDAMLGLVVAAIGALVVVIAFQIAESKKRTIAYWIAGVLVVCGLYYFISAEMRGVKMRRRISDIQRQQEVNLEQIQKRLQETQAQPNQAPAKK